MKERNYDFSRHVRQGPTVTKQEIVDSLIAFAKEKRVDTFTHKQYDAWNRRVLCASQISLRFGGWLKAMERAGLSPRWNFSKDPAEMLDLYMDCWEEHDDCPTEKAFVQYLSRVDSKYTVNIYKRHFGGLRRLAQRVIDFHAKRISEKQLVAKWNPPRTRRGPLSASLRFEVLERDGFKCGACGRSPKIDGVKLEVDHKIPVSEGGTDDISNLHTLCDYCNKGKSDNTFTNAGGL